MPGGTLYPGGGDTVSGGTRYPSYTGTLNGTMNFTRINMCTSK